VVRSVCAVVSFIAVYGWPGLVRSYTEITLAVGIELPEVQKKCSPHTTEIHVHLARRSVLCLLDV
jgi:hypothetical protein